MILVTGATGSIGRALVARLRVPFTALVRSEAKGTELGVPFTVGDFDDPASIARALRGVDTLFLNAGGAIPVNGEQPMVRQQIGAIDAAAAAGVARIVKISVWRARPGGLLAEGAHAAIEEHLKRSGVAWSILQPSGFMQNFGTGAGVFTDNGHLLGAYGDAPVSYVDCADIAACAAALLTGPGRSGETFVLTGPQALNHTEIAAKLSAVAGRRVDYLDLSPGELAERVVALGAPASFARDVAALVAQVADGALSATTTAVAELTGRPARTFDEFLRDNADVVRRSWA